MPQIDVFTFEVQGPTKLRSLAIF